MCPMASNWKSWDSNPGYSLQIVAAPHTHEPLPAAETQSRGHPEARKVCALLQKSMVTRRRWWSSSLIQRQVSIRAIDEDMKGIISGCWSQRESRKRPHRVGGLHTP